MTNGVCFLFGDEAPDFDDEHRRWRARVYAMEAKLDLWEEPDGGWRHWRPGTST